MESGQAKLDMINLTQLLEQDAPKGRLDLAALEIASIPAGINRRLLPRSGDDRLIPRGGWVFNQTPGLPHLALRVSISANREYSVASPLCAALNAAQ